MEKKLKRTIIFSVLFIGASIIGTVVGDDPAILAAIIPGFIGVIGLIIELFRK